MKKYIDKADLVVRIEKLQSEIAEEKKLHEDNFMWYNGINHGFNLTKGILNTLEVKEVDIASMADDYYDALMKEASDWMDEGTMGHCRLAYYTGCKDVLAKLQKGDNV